MTSTKERLEDIDLSTDEISRLTKAFKNEEFRKLFKEYAEEIADPENRRRYEEEITAMENERGMDVEFIHPEPGYVVKTTVDRTLKAFINICKSDKIGKPSTRRDIGPDAKLGLSWSIPHSFAPPRDDIDKNNGKCKVYDFVIHPDTYRMAETNARFKDMINSTAYDGIEKQFHVQLDRKNARFPKIIFKGSPAPTVIRSRSGSQPKDEKDDDPKNIMNSFPYPYNDKTTKEKSEVRNADAERRAAEKAEKQTDWEKNEEKEYTKPKYTVKHRSEMDFQDFRDARDAKTRTRPKELVVDVELPLIDKASQVDLDIFEKGLSLQSENPAKYKLELTLPYPVDENEGSATFDKVKRTLVITLPVLPAVILHLDTVHSVVNGTDELHHETSVDVTNGKPEKVEGDDMDWTEVDTTAANGDIPHDHFTRGALIAVISKSTPCEHSGATDVPAESPKHAEEQSVLLEVQASSSTESLTQVEFDYHQTDESAVFVLHSGKVDRSTVHLTFPEGSNSVAVKMTSVGSGGFPVHYSLYIKFLAECALASDNCQADVDCQNVVLVLVKSDAAIGHWDRFEAGTDAEHTKELFFVTRASLQSQLYDLSPEDGSPAVKDAPELDITEMDSEKLVVNIKEQKSTSRRKKHLSESAEDIEIVHERELPMELKSIIKQRSRTTSESSEDPLSSSYGRQNSTTSFCGSESSLAESDENADSSSSGRRKTVSFSEHIDKTTYKSNQSVSSMRSTLRNKRKKQRQTERKHQEKQQRHRRKSSGSEGPSSDDGCSTDPKVTVTTGPPEISPVELPYPGCGVEGDDEASPSVSKMETMMFDKDWGRSEVDDGQNGVNASQDIKVISNDSDTQADSCDLSDDASPQNNIHTCIDDDQNVESQPKDLALDDSLSSSKEIQGASLIQELDPESTRNTDCVLESKSEEPKKTVLDWSDGKSVEHSTTCAFKFTNDVMFDLDVD